MLTFEAEIVEIKQRKTVDVEHEYTLKLRTTDNKIMTLAGIPADCTVKVTVEKGG